jgi:hypothetical protein
MSAAVSFVVRVKTKNPLNEHTGNSRLAAIIRKNQRREHRTAARYETLAALHKARVSRADLVPAVVTLTRVSAGVMDDDGLAASQKGLRDGIADALGVNDGGPFVRWQYRQRKGRVRVYAVIVRIERERPR